MPEALRRAFARRLADIGPDLVRIEAGQGAVTASVYHPIRGEVDTMPLLAAMAARGITTALPVIGGRRTPLRFVAWAPGDAVASGSRFGIPEPLPGAAAVEPDVVFVPVAAFDRRGHRLGYGAGFYDATLAALRASKAVHAVGIAFSVQEVERVPAEGHDERLDAVITETDVILCGPDRA